MALPPPDVPDLVSPVLPGLVLDLVLSRPVSKIMTAVISTCSKTDTVDSISVLMTENRVRHVPVLDDGKLIGIVSIGDIVKTRIEELEAEHQQLQSYITQG